MPSERAVALPGGWAHHVKSGLLHAISLAAMALTVARSRHTGSRLQTELDRVYWSTDFIPAFEPQNFIPIKML